MKLWIGILLIFTHAAAYVAGAFVGYENGKDEGTSGPRSFPCGVDTGAVLRDLRQVVLHASWYTVRHPFGVVRASWVMYWETFQPYCWNQSDNCEGEVGSPRPAERRFRWSALRRESGRWYVSEYNLWWVWDRKSFV